MELSDEELEEVNTNVKAAVEAACKETGITDPAEISKLEAALFTIYKDDTPIYKAMGVPDEVIESGYAFGFTLYRSGKFNDAIVVFRNLLEADGLNPRYYYSLGACYHQLKQYEEASVYYQTAAHLDPKNPIPCYHLYDCMTQLDDQESAAMALQMVILRTENVPKFQKFYQMARANLDSLIQSIKNKKLKKK